MANLNLNFNGEILPKEDLVAYVDESGDEGFNFSRPNHCKWFVVSAIVSSLDESNNMLQSLHSYMQKYKPTKRITKMSFKDLDKHNDRKNLLGMISKHKYLTTHSVFYKPNIDQNDPLYTYPSMYFVGIKNLIERLSWLTKQYNKRKIHIAISNRNSIPSINMQTYLFTTSVSAERNLTYFDKLGKVVLSTPHINPKLLFADYASYSMRVCLEKETEAQVVEPTYFNILLKDKLFSSNHPKYNGVWNNGIKCTPGNKQLIEYDGILNEGSHKF
jgi:hypothetical protein